MVFLSRDSRPRLALARGENCSASSLSFQARFENHDLTSYKSHYSKRNPGHCSLTTYESRRKSVLVGNHASPNYSICSALPYYDRP
ncbi:hypothetical protein KP509_28G047500 [Ceratopteris richardii]|uniref:Uncharacterized protein n=1 Tax=Ceratopteris richardii TaxID=49495 RepID=A0A8T2RDN5_CERRI|nr:hypothetical protein KP509_28G047500 [Ceratopteris richardii]